MACYVLRDSNGILRSKFSSTIARKIMDGSTGFFREATYTNRGKVTVFEITEGSKLSLMGLDVFFWAGDTLIPERG